VFPRDMVCLRNISVDTMHKGETEDNNNNVIIMAIMMMMIIIESIVPSRNIGCL
jgi:hypothetical protein